MLVVLQLLVCNTRTGKIALSQELKKSQCRNSLALLRTYLTWMVILPLILTDDSAKIDVYSKIANNKNACMSLNGLLLYFPTTVGAIYLCIFCLWIHVNMSKIAAVKIRYKHVHNSIIMNAPTMSLAHYINKWVWIQWILTAYRANANDTNQLKYNENEGNSNNKGIMTSGSYSATTASTLPSFFYLIKCEARRI